jgi:sterol desaturase/sphingolipid hydroxylase (fatty acid hydroxylase superfamily)
MLLLVLNFMIYWGLSIYLDPNTKSYNIDHIIVVLLNQCIITPIMFILFCINNKDFEFIQSCFDICICLIIEYSLFYLIHRLFHMNKFLYRNIHSYHHYYSVSRPFITHYCHWIEHVCLNLFPLFIGINITRMNYVVVCIFITIVNIRSILTHYEKYTDRFHIDHHRFQYCNFGVSNELDNLFQTNKDSFN